MKKRIAYIGLSYPLFYDYKNTANKTDNDLNSSPNPIIESPLGLMILFDELWFLCESLCPSNMRMLPYVKFVDKNFIDLNFEGAEKFISDNIEVYNNVEDFDFDIWHKRRLEIDFGSLDIHTHTLKIGEINTNANGGRAYTLLFDTYILKLLQFKVGDSIELVSNSMLNLTDYGIVNTEIVNKESSLVERLIIPNIPNYLSEQGPYHEAIEDLRDDSFLVDFRKWIIEEREQIKTQECDEIINEVINSIQKKKDELFEKHINYNKYKYFESMAKTLIGTIFAPIDICFAFGDHLDETKKLIDVKNTRWQGFVSNAQNVITNNNLNKS